MVEYIRGSEFDKWHWCKNCTQYPMYIYQKTSVKPFSDFCDQCKMKEEDGICQSEELDKVTPKRALKRELEESHYNIV